MKSVPATQAVAAAARARVSVGLGLEDRAFPFDAAITLGLQVRLLSLGSLEGMYEPGEPGLIVVGSERPAGRRNFTCAHELGHHCFGHGRRVDELFNQSEQESRDPMELLADRFAAAFLMPKTLVASTFARRGWEISGITARQLYLAACSMGVGYSTLIDHMAISLRMLSHTQRQHLRRVRPKALRADILGFEPPHDLIVVDGCWRARWVDLEVGDFVLLPAGSTISASTLEAHGRPDLFEAKRPGIAPISLGLDTKRSLEVRVSRRAFAGLVENRHLEEPEE